MSRLADDLPQVAELDLNPVLACPGGATVVDARVRVTSHAAADPFLRQLPAARSQRRPAPNADFPTLVPEGAAHYDRDRQAGTQYR